LTILSALLLQTRIWEHWSISKPIPLIVFVLLLLASLFSWAVIFSKLGMLKRARLANHQFLRAFRKATGFEAVTVVLEQFRAAPAVGMFETAYGELARQVKARGTLTNRLALERSLQIGASEEVMKLEANLGWLATTAAVSPFVGLFGTVWGIMDAFEALGGSGSASLRLVGPGIADALVATAVGLFAAIPAAVFYNHFGNTVKEIGARLDDFGLEFMNFAERVFED